jgi:hypothetical protein
MKMPEMNAKLEAEKGYSSTLEDTLHDIKDECRKATADDWRDRIEHIVYLVNSALLES